MKYFRYFILILSVCLLFFALAILISDVISFLKMNKKALIIDNPLAVYAIKDSGFEDHESLIRNGYKWIEAKGKIEGDKEIMAGAWVKANKEAEIVFSAGKPEIRPKDDKLEGFEYTNAVRMYIILNEDK